MAISSHNPGGWYGFTLGPPSRSTSNHSRRALDRAPFPHPVDERGPRARRWFCGSCARQLLAWPSISADTLRSSQLSSAAPSHSTHSQ
jgi:hypothetical protein